MNISHNITKLITTFTIFLFIFNVMSVSSITITNQTYNENNDCNYDLLIITPRRFKLALRPLENHKERHQIETKIVDLKTIYDKMATTGIDNQEKIKYFIKSELENYSISYVLLIGHFKLLPIRYSYNIGQRTHSSELKFISDLYYADIFDSNSNFSSWDYNNNGVYGEWNNSPAEDRDIDLIPDVCVGRLPCANIFEVRCMVRKIIRYETKTYGKSWFNRMIGVGGDSYIEYEGNEGEINTQNAMNFMTGFTHIKLWASNGNLTGDISVIRELNKGCGFIYFDGHGLPNNWATYVPGEHTYINGLHNNNMIFLVNYNKLPICVVSGCHNCQFDVHISRIFSDSYNQYTWIRECWGWHLISKFIGGSIATIGNTGLGYSKEDKESKEGADSFLDPQFFWEYNINGTDILGKNWANTLTTYLKEFPIDWNTLGGSDSSIDAKTVQQWVLLGDPSLKIGGYN